jgi:tetratricopeptide (TPR) repeat protein
MPSPRKRTFETRATIQHPGVAAMRSRRWILVAVCLLLPAAVRADEWPVERGPSREPAPYRYDSKAAIPRAFLDEALACVIYSGTTYIIEDDGTVESISHEVVRLNSRKAIERLGECQDIFYNPVWQKLVLNEARVIKPSGVVVEVEPRHVHFRDANTDFLVYDRDKQLVISFPALETGDVIEVKWTTRGKNPEFFGQFFSRNTFGDDRFPTVCDELRVRLGKDRPFHFRAINGQLEPKVQAEGNTRWHAWKVENRPALPRDDNLPSRETLRLQVVFSTFADWAAVEKWKRKIRADCWECTPQIKAVVKDVVGELTSEEDKARALTQWVRRRIRYISVAANGAGYTPQVPARVLENRYGDCKDQTQLLAVMMREAGLKVELVTLGALDDGQVLADVPMPWGTHAILLVTLGGTEHWVDTTVSGCAWNFLPREDRDRAAYAVGDGGIRLVRTPPGRADDNRVETTTTLQILGDGSALCKRQGTYFGSAALAQRDAWFETPAGERKRLATADLQDAHSRAKLERLEVDDKTLGNWEGPVKASLDFALPGHFSGAIEKEGSLSDVKVWNRLLSITLDDDRTAPLDLGSPFESTHRFVVQLPVAGRYASLPQDQEVKSRWGRFQVKATADKANPKLVEVVFHTRIEETLVEPADFPEFRAFREALASSWRVWLSYVPTADTADIPLLAGWFLLRPSDSQVAHTLAQLLVEDGNQTAAEAVLALALTLRPNDQKLWETAVKLAANPKALEKLYAKMTEHFPENTDYAVQLGAVRVKLGDHAGARKVLEPLAESAAEPAKGLAHLQLARSLLSQGKAGRALEHLQVIDIKGLDTSAAVQLALLEGGALELSHAPAKAIDAYRGALVLEPDNRAAMRGVIRLAVQTGKRNDAIAVLRRFTVAVADDDDGLEEAAAWNLQLGRLDEAKDVLMRVGPTRLSALGERTLGLVCAAHGEHAKVVALLESADLDDKVLPALIEAHLALGQLRQALTLVEKSRPFCQANPDLAKTAQMLQKLGERRLAYVNKARIGNDEVARYSEAIDAALCAGSALRDGANAARAESLVEAALAKEPRCGLALAVRGWLRLERGQLGKALADSEAALGMDPEEAIAYFVRGRVRLERLSGDAQGDLSKAARLTQRRDGRVLHWLAAAQRQAGQHEKALATQGEAAMLLPHVPEIREQLEAFRR